jgi:hypothetical protein
MTSAETADFTLDAVVKVAADLTPGGPNPRRT